MADFTKLSPEEIASLGDELVAKGREMIRVARDLSRLETSTSISLRQEAAELYTSVAKPTLAEDVLTARIDEPVDLELRA